MQHETAKTAPLLFQNLAPWDFPSVIPHFKVMAVRGKNQGDVTYSLLWGLILADIVTSACAKVGR
jgi:hypothetical protein